MLEIKNTVLVVVFIFLKHNSLCGRLVDSDYFYTEESIQCTNFCVHITLFACTLCAWFVEVCIWKTVGNHAGSVDFLLLCSCPVKSSLLKMEQSEI